MPCLLGACFLIVCALTQPIMSAASDSKTDPIAAFPPEIQEKLAELRRQSDALPRPHALDAATLRGIKDQDLGFAISWYIGERIRTSGLDRHTVLQQETAAARDFYLATLVEAEVLNGGFNQYFWNVPSELLSQTASALERIGATRALKVFKAAIRLGEAEADMRREFKSKGTLQGFSDSYKHTKLAPLDDAFTATTAELEARRIAFVRANETAFLRPSR